MGFLRNWVGMLRGVGPRNVLIVGLVRSLLNMSYFECAPYDLYMYILRFGPFIKASD